MLAILCFAIGVIRAEAAFTSLYVYGDSLSCTTTNPGAGSLYYGNRYSNGRVWVEVLAQQQGLTLFSSNNISYFGNTSTSLLAQANAFIAPPDVNSALVVVWVNNADLYYPSLDPSPTLTKFTAAINQAQTNHFKAITNFYAKGVRSLIMPNVVDISTIPQFNTYTAQTNLFHQASVNYNIAFNATIERARTNCPGLLIYVPDFYSLLANILAYASTFGLTNTLGNGRSISAIDSVNYGLPQASINGYGTNYIFWDPTDPTAKVHNWMASLAQQLIAPVKIGQVTAISGSNLLQVLNVPVGQNGLVLGRGDLSLGNWTTSTSFSSTNTSQSIVVPASGSQQFYQLSFPVVWTWP